MLDIILHMIMDGKVELHQLLAAKKKLTFCRTQCVGYDEEMERALGLIYEYVSYKNAIPEETQDLTDFVVAAGKLSEKIPSQIRQWYIVQKPRYIEAVCWLEKELNSGTVVETDWDVAVDLAFTEARQTYWQDTYDTAKKIVAGSVDNPKEPTKPWSGIGDARRYIRERMLGDVYDAGSIEGDFRDNLPLVQQDLLNALEDPDDKRCYTGFPSIDETQLIGPSQELRTVGIAGFTNHGKSLFMMTMLYNMMRQGKRILFIPLEFSPMQAWKRVAWLHMQYQDKINLPSLAHWETHPKDVTPDHIANLNTLIEELKAGTTLPGKLDVHHATTWPEIVELVNGSPVPYDVLCVDYIAHLKYEGRDRREGISRIFQESQQLALHYRDDRGLVVITPVQTNKEGFKAAGDWALDSPNYGKYDLIHVDTFTDAVRDMDLVINVWHHGDILKATSTSKISEMKSRLQVHFPNFYLKTDQRTRYMREISDAEFRAAVSANIQLEAQMEDEIAEKNKKKGRGTRTPHDWPPRGRYAPKPAKDTSLERLKTEADLDDIRNRFDFDDFADLQ